MSHGIDGLKEQFEGARVLLKGDRFFEYFKSGWRETCCVGSRFFVVI
jgi:hypothetical protein